MTLIAGRLALGGHDAPGWVRVDGGATLGAGHGPPPGEPDERVAGLLAPGLVDLQVNGAAGHEVTGDDEALDAIEDALRARGVTCWLPTVITADERAATRTVDRLAERAADPGSPIAGVHVEGPFLSPDHAGMHRRRLLRSPADGVPAYLRHPAVRVVTLAPELPGALDLVERLAASGVVVSLGHSGADAATALAALDAGARMVTHLLNAMGPLHHRAPGLVGVALADPRPALGLIADGVHVDPLVLGLVSRLAGDRVVLVSDASPAAAGGRVATFAGVRLDAEGRAPDGHPAGSLRLLDDDLRIWCAAAGRGLGAALAAATGRPAALLGRPAPLSPGAPADLVELDADGGLRRVMVAGSWR